MLENTVSHWMTSIYQVITSKILKLQEVFKFVINNLIVRWRLSIHWQSVFQGLHKCFWTSGSLLDPDLEVRRMGRRSTSSAALAEDLQDRWRTEGDAFFSFHVLNPSERGAARQIRGRVLKTNLRAAGFVVAASVFYVFVECWLNLWKQIHKPQVDVGSSFRVGNWMHHDKWKRGGCYCSLWLRAGACSVLQMCFFKAVARSMRFLFWWYSHPAWKLTRKQDRYRHIGLFLFALLKFDITKVFTVSPEQCVCKMYVGFRSHCSSEVMPVKFFSSHCTFVLEGIVYCTF